MTVNGKGVNTKQYVKPMAYCWLVSWGWGRKVPHDTNPFRVADLK